MTGIAFVRLMLAIKSEASKIMVEGGGVEAADVCVAPLVIRMAGAAVALQLAVEALPLRHHRGDLTMAVQACGIGRRLHSLVTGGTRGDAAIVSMCRNQRSRRERGMILFAQREQTFRHSLRPIPPRDSAGDHQRGSPCQQ